MSANSYVQGWRERDERYADLVTGKRNGHIAAAGFLLVKGCFALAGLIPPGRRTSREVLAR